MARRYRLLYLDDDEGNLSVFELSFLGQYDIVTETSPERARQRLDAEPFDILLVDQRMPDMTGTEFLMSIRASHPQLVKFIITAYADVAVVTEALNQCGIYRYIAKPWNRTELAQALESAVQVIQLREHNFQLLSALQDRTRELEASLQDTKRMNERLAAYSLQLVQQNTGVAALREQVRDLTDLLGKAQERVRRLGSEVQTTARADGRWAEFLSLFDGVQTDFLRRLQTLYPNLTQAERRLCALLRLNLATKDIAAITHISPHSVNVARYRLRKKFGLGEAESLEQFIAQV